MGRWNSENLKCGQACIKLSLQHDMQVFSQRLSSTLDSISNDKVFLDLSERETLKSSFHSY